MCHWGDIMTWLLSTEIIAIPCAEPTRPSGRQGEGIASSIRDNVSRYHSNEQWVQVLIGALRERDGPQGLPRNAEKKIGRPSPSGSDVPLSFVFWFGRLCVENPSDRFLFQRDWPAFLFRQLSFSFAACLAVSDNIMHLLRMPDSTKEPQCSERMAKFISICKALIS